MDLGRVLEEGFCNQNSEGLIETSNVSSQDRIPPAAFRMALDQFMNEIIQQDCPR